MCDRIYCIDKPVGYSSFQMVRLYKRLHKKVGHAGTLDPFASGLLLILVGNATKKFNEIQTLQKEYRGAMVMGIVSDTYDISGRLESRENTCCPVSWEKLKQVAAGFVGEFDQVPPPFSALKRRGKKLYELSRQGVKIVPRSRKVSVQAFSITYFEWPYAEFTALVNTGVYIRSLVHDLGTRLNCGATVLSLRRMRIGQYVVDDAVSLGEILQKTQG
jgi:tRNA pseudouridine55 synthase